MDTWYLQCMLYCHDDKCQEHSLKIFLIKKQILRSDLIRNIYGNQ